MWRLWNLANTPLQTGWPQLYKFGAKEGVTRLVQRLSKNIGRLINGGYKVNSMTTNNNFFTNEVIVKFDVMSVSMEDGVCSHVGGVEIVAVKMNKKLYRDTKLI
ncbi:unnamed protein product [Prunus armeniaca]|uniref:Uncharacterized protein n=1 Tax=Prunus armeniaca TaxID=36596 RepID=A0A6J5WGR2_PRUAR|nr:unnamed protein product [Prunus armeniaca]CAB4299503.1 unnamed protein product [Prunus armeniaca]